jgi:hypothetical protein
MSQHLQNLADLLQDIRDEDEPDINNLRNVATEAIQTIQSITHPTFDDIDSMLIIASILLAFEIMPEYSTFVQQAPEKFKIAYSNNTTTIPSILYKLDKMKMYEFKQYLSTYINSNTKTVLNEIYRNNLFPHSNSNISP